MAYVFLLLTYFDSNFLLFIPREKTIEKGSRGPFLQQLVESRSGIVSPAPPSGGLVDDRLALASRDHMSGLCIQGPASG